MPSTHVLQAGAQRRPRHDPRRLQPQGLRDDRERVCRDSRPVRRGRQGLSFPQVRVWGGDASRARARENGTRTSHRSTFIHTSHTLCVTHTVACMCLCVVCCSASLLLVCSGVAPRAPRPPPEWPRDAREMTPHVSTHIECPRGRGRADARSPLPSGSPHSRKIYILNTKSHWDATTIIRSRATIPARSHEQFPTAQGSLNSRCQTPAPPASPA